MRRLYLRTCNDDFTSHGGFRWPSEVGAEVEAPDWSPEDHCGGGLHGLLWGEGQGGLFNLHESAVWIVFSSQDDPVDLRGKCKVKSARVEHVGDRDSAISYLLANGAADKAVVFARKTGGDGSTLTGGDDSTLTGGDGSTLTGGDRSTLTGGYYSTLTGGDGSTLTGGYGSTLTGGDRSTLTGGDRSTLTGGDRSTLTVGDYSTLTGGDGSTLTVGDYSTLTGGDDSTLAGGDRSTLTGGDRSTLTGGDGSTLCWRVFDGTRYRLHVRYVGEDGIEPNTPYRFGTAGMRSSESACAAGFGDPKDLDIKVRVEDIEEVRS